MGRIIRGSNDMAQQMIISILDGGRMTERSTS